MNRTDVIKKVSALSEVGIVDCEKVIDALENVLEEELSSSSFINAFEKFTKLMKMFKNK